MDDAIPPLFGYQPYDASWGYQPYAGAPYGKTAMFAHNKVFPAAAFPDLLRGFWQASGNGTSADAAIFVQQLAVQPNAWFGIDAARDVTVVSLHLGFATAWQQLFASNPPVLATIQAEHTNQSFPNYPTIDTNLSATQVNLLADLTAWAVGTAAAQIAALFRRTAGAVD